MKRLIVAVSGGVDSVVLLHQLVRADTHELIVAHVDHGIRAESADDARFVAGLAANYGLLHESTRVELGAESSEADARHARYDYLTKLAAKYDADIATAHHLDDMVETIAINLTRGTGWRGVAVLGRRGVVRPLLAMTKSDIYDYALTHRLEWVEDATNHTDAYLRNRLRHCTMQLPRAVKESLAVLRHHQMKLAAEIDEAAATMAQRTASRRHEFVMSDPDVADELLRATFVQLNLTPPTRPQRDRAIMAIKVARPGTTHQIGDGVELRFSAREFVVVTPEK